MMAEKLGKCLMAVLMLATLMTGSSCGRPDEASSQYEMTSVEEVGTVPEELRKVVEGNLFQGAIAFEGTLLRGEPGERNEAERAQDYTIRMMDLYGNDICSYSFSVSDDYRVTTLTATQDGGFLFVLGFSDSFRDGKWASENPFSSRVVKCRRDGSLLFDAPFYGIEGGAFHFCLENNGRIYFFGTTETPDSKIAGVSSPTDIYELILDPQGKLLRSKIITGSGYDSLTVAEKSGDIFLLSISATSDDGDFAGSNSKGDPVDWVFSVNGDLDVLQKSRKTGRSIGDFRLGEKEGVTIFRSDPLLKNFDAGTPFAFASYGEYDLVVSENRTGAAPSTSHFSASPAYPTETVYSGYDKEGRLIFRTGVDN